MVRLLILVMLFGFAPLPWSATAQAESRHEGDWLMPSIRGVKQEGLEHRVCSLKMERLVLCFEFFWQNGLLRFWVQVTLQNESDRLFRDGYATDIWLDGTIVGRMYMGELTGTTNSLLDIDRFLGADRSQYYRYGGDWIFFQMVAAPPPDYLSNRKTFYYKITHAEHLRLVHYLDDGSTFDTEYDLDGLTVLLTAAFEEAAAMEHKFGRKPAVE